MLLLASIGVMPLLSSWGLFWLLHTFDLEMFAPPSASTKKPTFRVSAWRCHPPQAFITKAARALSTLRRVSSKSGKKLPCLSLGMARLRPSTWW